MIRHGNFSILGLKCINAERIRKADRDERIKQGKRSKTDIVEEEEGI